MVTEAGPLFTPQSLSEGGYILPGSDTSSRMAAFLVRFPGQLQRITGPVLQNKAAVRDSRAAIWTGRSAEGYRIADLELVNWQLDWRSQAS